MCTDFTFASKCTRPVETRSRRIATDLPVPESLPLVETLRQFERHAMAGQPPVIWRGAEMVATPRNSACNDPVIHAARRSIPEGGRMVEVRR